MLWPTLVHLRKFRWGFAPGMVERLRNDDFPGPLILPASVATVHSRTGCPVASRWAGPKWVQQVVSLFGSFLRVSRRHK